MSTLTQNDLTQFSGSECLYKMSEISILRYTEGVRYLAQNGGAYWLLDAIEIYQHDKLIKNNQRLQDFQLWQLQLDGKGGCWLICSEDSNVKPIIRQYIPYTDFPFSIKLYVECGCLLLPNEH
jgi:hypothetical protein